MRKIVTGTTRASDAGAHPAPPCTMVVFGAGGDLTKRLLVPAIYNLAVSGLLHDGFRLIGVDISFNDADAWRAFLEAQMQAFVDDPTGEFHPDAIDAQAWSWLGERVDYVRADFTDSATHAALKERIGDGSAIFYLAVAARFFEPISERLGEGGLMREANGAFRRLVVEKPFGSDLTSARALNAALLARMSEQQIYRIDHFMGKETVQSILTMRFANAMFEPLWNRDHIASVEITATETIGVEGRGRFYEQTGALRDMVPNHLFQLLCVVAMDPPASLAAESVRAEKTRLLQAVRPLRKHDVTFGRYEAGEIGGKALVGYREEPNVSPASETETFVAARLDVRNWRWAGVPFVLRTGKRLGARATRVVLQFRPAPYELFPGVPEGGDTSDRITIEIGPDQAIEIAFDVKRPGPHLELAKATTRFDFADAFAEEPNVGYEALLLDCMEGDATLFQRADTIEAAWAVVDPVLAGRSRPAVKPYAAGSDGPASANDLAPFGWSKQ